MYKYSTCKKKQQRKYRYHMVLPMKGNGTGDSTEEYFKSTVRYFEDSATVHRMYSTVLWKRTPCATMCITHRWIIRLGKSAHVYALIKIWGRGSYVHSSTQDSKTLQYSQNLPWPLKFPAWAHFPREIQTKMSLMDIGPIIFGPKDDLISWLRTKRSC